MLRHLRTILALALLLPTTIALAQDDSGSHPPLQIGEILTGTSDSDNPTIYRFESEGPGLLALALRGRGEADLKIIVSDDLGQALPQGTIDRDLGGSRGTEQDLLTIPHAGNYLVTVGFFGSGKAIFDLAASWIDFPGVGSPPDPDGKPDGATSLEIGKRVNDSLDSSSGDNRDWYAIRLEESGTVTVLTRAEEGDLALEFYEKGQYAEPSERSDQDLQEKAGNESISVQAKAGQVLHFRVVPAFGGGSIEYSITSGFIPD